MSQRVALVTGSNKGIGFATVRSLCKKFEGDVFLTARDVSRGKKAVQDLQQEGLHPKFHQLDINDKSSIETLKTYLLQNYGGLDVLVNNAAIAYAGASTVPFEEQAKATMRTNYWALKDTCEILFPILRPHARVVNLASMVSHMFLSRCSPDVKKRILTSTSIDAIDNLATEYEKGSVSGTLKTGGWPEWGYGASKVMVRLLTPVQQLSMDSDPREDVVLNSCCPGFVGTDMNHHKGPLTIDEGADTPTYLALLPSGITSPKGQYLSQRKIEHWK